jgi:phage-related protein
MWEIEFFEKENRRCPVNDFLDTDCSAEEKVLIVNAIERLQLYGNNLRRPYIENLEDGIYELRVRSKRTRFRFLYFYVKQKIVITHGFKKKSGPVPQQEIEKAKNYRTIYLQRM